MASQPANTAISVFYTVRTRTNVPRFATVKEMCQKMGVKQVMVPGEEIETYNVLDASTAVPGWRYGLPVTVENRQPLTVAAAYAGVAGLDFPQQLVGGTNDLFLVKKPAGKADDLQGQVRAAAPAPRGLFRAV